GTGSEATKNSVISSREPAFKKSLRSDRMVPRVVLIDPYLTTFAPANVTAWSGLDAITQLIESFLSKKAAPIPQALALEGLAKAVPSLLPAIRDPQCRWARENLAHAAYLSGLALANSGLGLAHGVAAALGAVCGTPHGLACAVMLPVALRFNRETKLAELAKLAPVVVGPREYSSNAEAADAVIEAVENLCRDARIPRSLSELGVKPSQLDALVEGSQGNSLSGNPRAISPSELRDLLEKLL
ncbi:MAG TPA: iron-containing alcohol dehydrogenase, partial [Pirellulales bacterium]